MRTAATALALAALLALASTTQAFVLWLDGPSGPPERGPDHDGDGVPSEIIVPMARSPPTRIQFDPDDQDPLQPAPRVERCAEMLTDICISIGASGSWTTVRGKVAPEHECKTGRLTLCWKWEVHLEYETRRDGYPERGGIDAITILP